MSVIVVRKPNESVIVVRPVKASLLVTSSRGPQGSRGPEGDPSPTLSMSGILVTAIGKSRWYVADDFAIDEVRVSVGTQPDGADLIIDVNKNGISIFDSGNEPTISTGQNSIVAIPDVVVASDGDYFTVDIDQVGVVEPGRDLTVQVQLRRP